MSQPLLDPVTVLPMDRYNQELVANLHPPDWVNPQPAACYNLVVIGGGTAGLVTAAGAALLGAKVAMVEKHLLGGDCTNVGCVPSKTLIRSARAIADVQQGHRFGVRVPEGVSLDFAAVMERMRQVRAKISYHDSAQRFQQDYGVDVFLGEAVFSGPDTVQVGKQTLRFRKAAIATGSQPAKLPIPGLEAAGYLTNETIFSLTQRPDRLAVIGGGYIGCELAQTFRRFGCEVVLLQRSDRILTQSDPEAAAIVQQALEKEGVQLILQAKVQQVRIVENAKVIDYEVNGQSQSVTVDEILVAAGRSPSINSLNLAAVGVECDAKQGVVINDYLQTTNPRIYAVGDVCMQWKFTHAADAAARILIQNALFATWGIGRKKLSSLVMPACTYTDPEVAQVGLSAQEVASQGDQIETFYLPLTEVDRAIADGETQGFAKIHVKKGSDKILSATVVARHAGEMINEITLAMTNGLGLSAIANTIHPYPTQAEAIRKAADIYSLNRLTSPVIKKIASTWLTWKR